jgi:hypothetical protein
MLLSVREDGVSDARQGLESIAAFRGFSILLMVLADYLTGPLWLVGLQALFMVGTLRWVGWGLDRRHFHIAL